MLKKTTAIVISAALLTSSAIAANKTFSGSWMHHTVTVENSSGLQITVGGVAKQPTSIGHSTELYHFYITNNGANVDQGNWGARFDGQYDPDKHIFTVVRTNGTVGDPKDSLAFEIKPGSDLEFEGYGLTNKVSAYLTGNKTLEKGNTSAWGKFVTPYAQEVNPGLYTLSGTAVYYQQ